MTAISVLVNLKIAFLVLFRPTHRALSSRITDSQLRVYNTNDTSEVFEDRLMRIAKNGSNRFHPTLILLGIRLGIDRVTPVYWNGLTASLQYPQSIGIAG